MITIKHLFSLILAVTPVAVRETISFQLSYSPQRSGTHHAHPLLIRAVTWLESCVVSRPELGTSATCGAQQHLDLYSSICLRSTHLLFLRTPQSSQSLRNAIMPPRYGTLSHEISVAVTLG